MPKDNPMERALALLNFAKSVEPSALRDIEQIAAVTDGHGANRNGVPSKAEVPTSESLSMRGGSATPEIDANSDLRRQEGLARDYEEMSRRMERMEKSTASIASAFLAMTKAAEGPSDRFMHESDTTKEVEKALRKARMAVRKAESAEDEEDVAEITEKAEAALKACDEELEKAEEKVESEETEKFCEKSLGELTGLRKSLRTLKAKRIAKAEEEVRVKEEEEAAKAAAAAKAEEEARKAEGADDMEKAATALKAIGLGDLFAKMQKSMTDAAQVSPAPDFFSKAQASAPTFAQRVEAAGLTAGEESIAESLHTRLELAKAGKIARTQFDDAVQAAPENVRNLFV